MKANLTAQIYKDNWQKMHIPKEVSYREVDANYGKFIMEPLYKGFGITIGHALRRISLSSLVGCAVTAVKIGGVSNEYETISGIQEDVLQILLNLKEVVFKPLIEDDFFELKLVQTGSRTVLAGDITCNEKVEIINPDHPICSLNEGAHIDMTIYVTMRRGFVVAEDNQTERVPAGAIFLDSSHSPIERVNYTVENTRLGDKTDYDRLIFELWTDGSISAPDAIAFAAKILKEYSSVLINFDEEQEIVEELPEEDETTYEPRIPTENPNLRKSIKDLELSARSVNCLQNAKIETIEQLVQRTETEMLGTKNFGHKSLQEIKGVLADMGLTLGMVLDKETD